MTAPKPDITPVMLTRQEAARLLRIGPDRFRALRPLLAKAGFPPPDPIIGLYYRGAIIDWLDRRNGIGVEYQTGSPAISARELENFGDD